MRHYALAQMHVWTIISVMIYSFNSNYCTYAFCVIKSNSETQNYVWEIQSHADEQTCTRASDWHSIKLNKACTERRPACILTAGEKRTIGGEDERSEQRKGSRQVSQCTGEVRQTTLHSTGGWRYQNPSHQTKHTAPNKDDNVPHTAALAHRRYTAESAKAQSRGKQAPIYIPAYTHCLSYLLHFDKINFLLFHSR